MTVELAHHDMQEHLLCLVITCPRKAQARTRLIEAGQLVPATPSF
ncbi:hypothetical protein AB0N05_08790 [Nocardia sp. NPDC051030]